MAQAKTLKTTPSREKFRIAKQFVKELQGIYGYGLKAVFVTGSVAANIAKSNSDIDLVYIFDGKNSRPDLKNRAKPQERLPLSNKFEVPLRGNEYTFHRIVRFGSKIHFTGLEERLFERIGKRIAVPVDCRPEVRAMHEGAVPIFGSKPYLRRYCGVAFNYPTLKTVHARYSTRPDLPMRVGFKRSARGRKRFG